MDNKELFSCYDHNYNTTTFSNDLKLFLCIPCIIGIDMICCPVGGVYACQNQCLNDDEYCPLTNDCYYLTKSRLSAPTTLHRYTLPPPPDYYSIQME